jgi:hypothetical protein
MLATFVYYNMRRLNGSELLPKVELIISLELTAIIIVPEIDVKLIN